ncbi:hypothetical protein ACH5RR_025927 [Cinchona calisaya]|uniref:Uncharacterized protein n=1 Tax=Cinchona calisaya TaxID=153742 RepID=A0ABD2Z4E9_9GENT
MASYEARTTRSQPKDKTWQPKNILKRTDVNQSQAGEGFGLSQSEKEVVLMVSSASHIPSTTNPSTATKPETVEPVALEIDKPQEDVLLKVDLSLSSKKHKIEIQDGAISKKVSARLGKLDFSQDQQVEVILDISKRTWTKKQYLIAKMMVTRLSVKSSASSTPSCLNDQQHDLEYSGNLGGHEFPWLVSGDYNMVAFTSEYLGSSM